MDTFDSGPGAWTTLDPTWAVTSNFVTSGTSSLFGQAPGTAINAVARRAPMTMPAAGGKVQFNHAYGFESDNTGNGPSIFYEGGVMEWSLSASGPWTSVSTANSCTGVAKWVSTTTYAAGNAVHLNGIKYTSLVANNLNHTPPNASFWTTIGGCDLVAGGADYNPTAVSDPGSALNGLPAFVDNSWGYVVTQLDMATLSALPVHFRFRVATNASVAAAGWYVDDFTLYTCENAGSPSPIPRRSWKPTRAR